MRKLGRWTLARPFAPITASLALLALSLMLSMSWSAARAADPSSLIPSTRWIFLDASLTAKTSEACNALAREFAEEIAKLNQQHQSCLQGSAQEPAGSEGCSKESCQHLHTTRDKATKKASEQNRICTERLNAYLAEESAKALRKQKEADEAERQKQARAAALAKQDKEERDQAQERERTAQEQATRDREDKARHDQKAADKLTKETQAGAQLAAQKEASEREAKRAQQEADLAARNLANSTVQNRQDPLAKSPGGGTQTKPTANPFPKRRKGTAAGGTDGNGADRSEKNPFDKTASQGSSSATATSSGPGTDGVRKDLEKNVSPGATTATAANPFEKSSELSQVAKSRSDAEWKVRKAREALAKNSDPSVVIPQIGSRQSQATASFAGLADKQMMRSTPTRQASAGSLAVYFSDAEAGKRGLRVISKYSVGKDSIDETSVAKTSIEKRVIDKFDGHSEIKIRVYEDPSNPGKAIVAVRGTDNLENWGNGNTGFKFPESSLDQYIATVGAVVREVSKVYGANSIMLTGHSLGGGVVNILGKASGLPTITFNAPPVDVYAVREQSLLIKASDALGQPRWIERQGGDAGNIVNFRVEGDPVSALPGRQFGRTIEIPAETQTGFSSPLDLISQPLNRHGMSTVEKWLMKCNDSPRCGQP